MKASPSLKMELTALLPNALVWNNLCARAAAVRLITQSTGAKRKGAVVSDSLSRLSGVRGRRTVW